MKKFIICILLCAALVPSVFASSDDDEYDYKEKVIGITPGVRLSILGLEPTLGLNISNLEIEGACALNTGWDGKQFGYAPSVSIAYNTNPFEKGGYTVFGGEYMYLSPAYMNMIATLLKDGDNRITIPSLHAFSVFYKGGYNFNNVVGMLWRIRLPLWIIDNEGGAQCNLNVTNLPGFAANFLIGVCTISLGVKFTI